MSIRPPTTSITSASGSFYGNVHGAIFTPIDKGGGNGLNYTYSGEIDCAVEGVGRFLQAYGESRYRLTGAIELVLAGLKDIKHCEPLLQRVLDAVAEPGNAACSGHKV